MKNRKLKKTLAVKKVYNVLKYHISWVGYNKNLKQYPVFNFKDRLEGETDFGALIAPGPKRPKLIKRTLKNTERIPLRYMHCRRGIY